MTLQEQKRKEKIVAGMRQLQARRHRQGMLSRRDDSELLKLEAELKGILYGDECSDNCYNCMVYPDDYICNKKRVKR